MRFTICMLLLFSSEDDILNDGDMNINIMGVSMKLCLIRNFVKVSHTIEFWKKKFTYFYFA